MEIKQGVDNAQNHGLPEAVWADHDSYPFFTLEWDIMVEPVEQTIYSDVRNIHQYHLAIGIVSGANRQLEQFIILGDYPK